MPRQRLSDQTNQLLKKVDRNLHKELGHLDATEPMLKSKAAGRGTGNNHYVIDSVINFALHYLNEELKGNDPSVKEVRLNTGKVVGEIV